MSASVLNIGTKREVFWDHYLVDLERTTASIRQLHPEWKGSCFLFDQGDEINGISYPCVVKDAKGYKMYYLPWHTITGPNGFWRSVATLCVLESDDGIHWTRPNLNIYDRPDLEINNVVIDELDDGAFVFYDSNPNCDTNERYKALTPRETKDDQLGGLWCYTSPDGYHFKLSHRLTSIGAFDSLNTAYWDGEKYCCYLRDYHDMAGDSWKDGILDFNTRRQVTTWANINAGKRDVRVMYSDDFRSWTVPKLIKFEDGMDYPIYTNNVVPYPRAPHIKIGFPVRYIERKEWTPNYDQIGSAEVKKVKMAEGHRHAKREGLAVTDCIFMCSRDGEMWHRVNEAFLAPGFETEVNWMYGDCYLGYNLIDSGREVYYLYERGNTGGFGQSKPLERYEIRKDGFACWMADGEERILVTKPLIFEGKDLHLNFQTSARGYIYVDVLDEMGAPLSEQESFEIFGNTIDRKICFADGTDFSAYAGSPVRLRFRMCEAKLYAMNFT